MIDWLFSQECSVTLIGPLSLFRAMGCLASEAVCSANVTLCATASTEAGAHYRRTMEVANCHNRFAVYVNQQGAIYPCMGLLDLPAAHMGFVHEPLEETVFGYRGTVLNFGELAHRGPRLTILDEGEVGESESYCARHRRALVGVDPAPLPVLTEVQGESIC